MEHEIESLKSEVFKLQRLLVEADERAVAAETKIAKLSGLLCQTICHLDRQQIPHHEITESEMEQVPDRIEVMVNEPALTFQHLYEANKDRFQSVYGCRLNDVSIERWVLTVCSETGDLAKLVNRRVNGDTISDLEILREAASIVIQVDLMVSALGYELSNAVSEKFDNVSDRVESLVKLDRRDPRYLRAFMNTQADDRTTFNTASPA